MASVDDIRPVFDSISKGASLDILLPKTEDFDVVAALKPESYDQVNRSSTRRNLYFDENASLLIVLKSSGDEDDLRILLPHLELTVSAHVLDAVASERGNSSAGKYDLTSKVVSASEIHQIVSKDDKTYAIWKLSIRLNRPRAKLQRPSVYFMSNLAINFKSLKPSRRDRGEILKSYEPVPANVLEPLQYDISLQRANIFLPENRITKVPPATLADANVPPIRGSSRTLPALPALFTRIRYSSLPESIIASLHVDTSTHLIGKATVDDVKLSLADASIHEITTKTEAPQTRAGDETVFLYNLRALSPPTSLSVISVEVRATIRGDDGSNAQLQTSWQAQIDLGQTSPRPSYRWAKPMSEAMHKSRLSSQIVNYQPISYDESQQKTSKTGERSVIFSFTAPAVVGRKGDFTIHVQCINRSDRPRRFSLQSAQPKKSTARRTGLPSLPETEPDSLTKMFDVPQGILSKPADVLDLNPDVKIGPLPAGACYETVMRFRAMGSGLLDLGLVKIIDLDSRQTVDVRELPDIVAHDRAA